MAFTVYYYSEHRALLVYCRVFSERVVHEKSLWLQLYHRLAHAANCYIPHTETVHPGSEESCA